MNDIHLPMVGICLAWIVTIIYVARLCQHSRDGSVGLPAAYLFSTTFLYASAFLYCVPGYTHRRIDSLPYLWSYNITNDTVLAGATQTCIAVLGFAAGVRLYHARLRRTGPARPVPAGPANTSFAREVPTLAAFTLFGFLIPFLKLDFPAASAISLVGQNVGVTLVCLGYHQANATGSTGGKWLWLGIGILIPIWNIVVWGFLSSGFTVATLVGAFLLMDTRARTWSTTKTSLAVLGVAYAWLSAFVAYLSGRDEIRNAVWGQANFGERFAVIGKAVSEIHLLSPFDFSSLDWIAARLNQAAFVGKLVEWHELFPDLRTYGASLLFSLMAWVPRAVWPGKPENAGNQFIQSNTGLQFSNARFGAGQIFEFYVSFGSIGVFFGLMFMGFVLAHLDRKAALSLRANRLYDCVRSFAMGAAMVVPLSDIFFMVSACAATWASLSAIAFATKALGGGAPARLPPHHVRR